MSEDTKKLVQKVGFKSIAANYIEDVQDSKVAMDISQNVNEDSGSGIVPILLSSFIPFHLFQLSASLF